MKTIWVALCLLSLHFHAGFSNEVEIDSEGNLIPDPGFGTRQSAGVAVSFLNTFTDKSISVNWDSERPGEDAVHMFDIPAKHNSNLNTFVGHRFFFTDPEDPANERIDEVVIIPKKRTYVIGPNSEASKLATSTPRAQPSYELSAGKALTADGRVTVIGRPTTSMSAKFRCLAKEVDYYYDDGREGTFQGTLTQGKETTTNTYEGHVFYFTKKGKKHEEIARFSMRKDQVHN
jgi:hypothetical protein